MTIGDFLNNGQFTINCGHIQIIRYTSPLDSPDGRGKSEVLYDSDRESGDPPASELLWHDITAMNVTRDGYLEIEFDANELVF